MREECLYAMIKCGEEGCDGLVIRRDVDGDCVHREVECQHCEEKVKFVDLKVCWDGNGIVDALSNRWLEG